MSATKNKRVYIFFTIFVTLATFILYKDHQKVNRSRKTTLQDRMTLSDERVKKLEKRYELIHQRFEKINDLSSHFGPLGSVTNLIKNRENAIKKEAREELLVAEVDRLMIKTSIESEKITSLVQIFETYPEAVEASAALKINEVPYRIKPQVEGEITSYNLFVHEENIDIAKDTIEKYVILIVKLLEFQTSEDNHKSNNIFAALHSNEIKFHMSMGYDKTNKHPAPFHDSKWIVYVLKEDLEKATRILKDANFM